MGRGWNESAKVKGHIAQVWCMVYKRQGKDTQDNMLGRQMVCSFQQHLALSHSACVIPSWCCSVTTEPYTLIRGKPCMLRTTPDILSNTACQLTTWW